MAQENRQPNVLKHGLLSDGSDICLPSFADCCGCSDGSSLSDLLKDVLVGDGESSSSSPARGVKNSGDSAYNKAKIRFNKKLQSKYHRDPGLLKIKLKRPNPCSKQKNGNRLSPIALRHSSFDETSIYLFQIFVVLFIVTLF